MEKCPYHEIEPQYNKTLFRKKIDFAGYRSLPELCDHRFYCPECRAGWEKNGKRVRDKYRKLAIGFYSSASKSSAAANWDKGVKNLVLAEFKKAAEGR